MNHSVLVVDDDSSVREALAQTLELANMTPVLASAFIAAKDHISPNFEGIILSDIRMPGRDGFYLLDHARKIDPELPVILLTGEGDIPMAVRAVGQGAFDFLEKPCAPDDLLPVLQRALKTRALVLENRRLKALVESGDPAARMLIGLSEQSERLRNQVRRAAGLDVDVLVMGPQGSGVSKVAEVIHLSSTRSKAPFEKRAGSGLTVDALSDALKKAQSGSLLIDEIGQVPAETQMMLLEQLETGIGVRVIAGSTQNLQDKTDIGAFSADLYYRLEAMPVRIPSLAERPDDIPVLFRHYVAQASEQAGLTAPEISQDIVADLMIRDWPGNARALMAEAMRFALGVEDRATPVDLGLTEQMARVERSLLIQALLRTGGSASVAAEGLQLPRKTFYDKLTRHGLKAEDYRND
ncbi:MAG: sigma-54 dependent transcriptional regulator [Paracoccaceae bacterium]